MNDALLPVLTTSNVKALSLALLLFIYVIIGLSTSEIHYTETIHRITVEKIFDQNLFGSRTADALAAVGLALLFGSLILPSRPYIWILSAAAFAGGIAAFVMESEVLAIAALATVPALAALAVAKHSAVSKNPGGRSKLSSIAFPEASKVGLAILLVISAIEAAALGRWITYPAFPTEMYGDASWKFAGLESALFNTMGLLSPILVVLIAFSFLYWWYFIDLSSRLVRRLTRSSGGKVLESIANNSTVQHATKPDNRRAGNFASHDGQIMTGEGLSSVLPRGQTTSAKQKAVPAAILCAAVVIASFVAIYAHLPGVNPSGAGVSTDERFYLNWLSEMRKNGDQGWGIAANAFYVNKGDRPVTLIIIAGLASVTGLGDLTIVRYLPVILAPAGVMSIYILTSGLRFGGGNPKLYGSFAALLAAFSPMVVVGEYAGLLANWLAIIPAFVLLHFMIKSWETERTGFQLLRYFLPIFGLLALVMGIHLYTWMHLLAITVLFYTLSLVFARRNTRNHRAKLTIFIIILASSVLLDFARTSYASVPSPFSPTSALGRNIELSDGSLSKWDELKFTLGVYVGGFLSNPMLFILTLLWVALRADFSIGLDRTVLVMLFLISFPIMFGTQEFQTRVLYNTPFVIPAAIILFAMGQKGGTPRRTIMILVTASLIMATYALRSMANLYLVAPEYYTLTDQFLLP